MKNERGNNTLSSVGMCFLGFILGAGVTLIFAEPENHLFMVILLVLIALSLIFVSAKYIVSELVLPHMAKRRAALRALGKHGVRIIRHDDTAKIAYKGILALLNDDTAKAEELLQKALSLSDSRQNQLFCLEWLRNLYENQENDS